MLWASENPLIDWLHGGQLLHAVYLVELFLAKLSERGARYRVVRSYATCVAHR